MFFFIVLAQGVSRRDHMRNEEIGKAATVQPITTHLHKRLHLYGHARRGYDSHITRTVGPTGYGRRRCEPQRKTNIKIYGHHQKRYKE